MSKLKVTAIGNSTGLILPREVLAKLRVERGDHLYLIETARGVELTPSDPELEEQMDAAETIMRRDRSVLKKLSE